MNIDTPEVQTFMLELYKMTDGDIAKQVSMHEVGAALGLDKGATSSMSEELIIEDLVELKTLAGGIGITEKGLELLQNAGCIAAPPSQAVQLSRNPVLDSQDIQQLEELIAEIRKITFELPGSYQQLEELIIDLKTIEIQLLSPRPKNGIVREIILSMQASLAKTGRKEIATTIENLIGK